MLMATRRVSPSGGNPRAAFQPSRQKLTSFFLMVLPDKHKQIASARWKSVAPPSIQRGRR